MKANEIISAKYEPTDEVSNDHKQFIGLICDWRSSHIINTGIYKGNWCMIPMTNLGSVYWVPSHHLIPNKLLTCCSKV